MRPMPECNRELIITFVIFVIGITATAFFTRLWEAARYEYTQDTSMAASSPTLTDQISWLIVKAKVPARIPHPNRGLCFTIDIINTLKPYGLSEDNRIKFTDLEELCGFTAGFYRPKGGNNMRIHSVSPKELAEFIQPTISVSKVRESEEQQEGEGESDKTINGKKATEQSTTHDTQTQGL
jgi:hypothetical protein